jgi:predicted glutamine amidotransferase
MEVTMCRWVAYAGPEIYLEDLVFHQEHSIVSQSLAANQSSWVTNGDGFGVAWYTQRTTPGLFKDVLPAWNDSNLRSLAAHIRTKLFFAHVRATTGTAVNRSNCLLFGKTGLSCTTEKSEIGIRVEKTLRILSIMCITRTEKVLLTVKHYF